MSKVSIIIPVYNKAPYLDSCISSVINQTYKNLEIIIIDDGSTDNSLEICEKYRKKDERIQLISQENQGVSVARNKGIQKASGEWIYFLDADDYLELDAFEILVNEIIQDKEIDLIEFGAKKWQNNELVGERIPSKKQIYTDNIKLIKENEVKPFSACLHFTKKDLLINNKIQFDEDLKHNEDALFMYKVFLNSKRTLVMDKCFYNIVLSENSATRSGVKKVQLLNNIQFADRLIDYCKANNVSIDLKNELNKLFNYFFISLLFYPSFFTDLKLLQSNFNRAYDKHKNILTINILKLARIHFLLILVPLFLKYRVFKRNHQL